VKVRRVFDERYYQRFYRQPGTRIANNADTRRLGAFISAYLGYLQLPVKRILDIGCGTGALGKVLQKHYPHASYTGVEFSSYACARYGWEQGSVTDYRSPRPFDLVICNDVLQYLPPAACERAIANLAEQCRGALYLGVMTRRDWQQTCDQTRTDDRVYLRSAEWYRNRLAEYFLSMGGSVYLGHGTPIYTYELERL
jgi:2-polyprenyl-3-methyl-5-hydroxy-6-metoxy-1,4-benzoquinol methylase